MARKSRRMLSAELTAMSAAPKRKAAAYIRLSRETESSKERDTIGSQTALVKDYIAHQDDMELYDVYVDDSVSGTTFTRPGFDRMLSDMRSGKIQVIVAKDMSRIGRDYIEAGNLVEHVFPLYGIRLVSITDGFDTDKDPGGVMMAVTNLTNAMYAQDISNKINAAKETMLKKGILLGRVPYGYKMNRKDTEHPIMEIDEEAAIVVKRIFSDFLAGIGTTAIARTLNEENVPTALSHRLIRNGDLEGARKYQWTANTVQQILYNETYTGRYAMGKTSQKLYRGKERVYIPQDKWFIYENHHPAIISKEDFALVIEKKQKKSKWKKKAPNILKNKIYCGCCGAHMGIPDSAAKTPKYVCRTNLYYGKGCESVCVNKTVVYNAVFHTIKDMVRVFLDEDGVIKNLKNRKNDRLSVEAHYRRELAQKNNELRCIESGKTSLYEDFCNGLLDENEYLTLNRQFTEKMKGLSEAIFVVSAQLEQERRTVPLIQLVRSLYNSREKESCHRLWQTH